MRSIIIIVLFLVASSSTNAQKNRDAIVGKWIAVPKRNVIVEVFKYHNQFKGKIVWFNDSDDATKPMNSRLDEKNPDPSLRNRKLVGLEVLNTLVYNTNDNRWESGIIYDAKSGKKWNSSCWITSDGSLEVRGFWHYEFIGKNMIFKKV